MIMKKGEISGKKVLVIQFFVLVAVIIAIYMFYPKMSFKMTGNMITFNPINAKMIIISENPDFSNARYLDIAENISIRLNPGTYYWKSSNGIIESRVQKFTIESEVGMEVENESLVNIGNVKINVTKDKNGELVGNIILEPDESQNIDSGNYTGRQAA